MTTDTSTGTGIQRGLAIALAACVLGTAPAARAFELDLYGQGHLSLDRIDDGIDEESKVASSSSRLGVRGSHALSEGMDVSFQYESGVDLTGQGGNDGNGPSDTSGLFTAARVSFVGLSGGLGTVRAGKLNVLNEWVYDYNLFADQVGDLGNLWGGSGLPGRQSNAVQYRSPERNGLAAGVTYLPDEDTSTNEDIWSVKIDYEHNALRLGGAYANLDQNGGNDWRVFAVTGSYGFGRFTLGGGWQRESDIGGIAGDDRDNFTLGGSMRVGSYGTVKAQLGHSAADAADSDATQWAVGYDHHLTEYATLYVAYASMDNDSLVRFTANNYGHGDAVSPVAGQGPSALSVGLIVRFEARLLPR